LASGEGRRRVGEGAEMRSGRVQARAEGDVRRSPHGLFTPIPIHTLISLLFSSHKKREGRTPPIPERELVQRADDRVGVEVLFSLGALWEEGRVSEVRRWSEKGE
jgi:hypothetical protein